MSITVEVYRGAGDRPGGEISEALLGDDVPAALARGRAELDANATAWERVSLECRYKPELRLGDVVEVDDPVLGAAWRGKIVGIVHSESDSEIVTKLDVRRPL